VGSRSFSAPLSSASYRCPTSQATRPSCTCRPSWAARSKGRLVGVIAGGIFGIFSFVQAEVPFFRDPLVSILPRLFIGVVAWIVFVSLRGWSVDLAAAAAGVLGSTANTVGVVGMAVLLGYLPLVAVIPILPQAIAEAVLAAVVTVVVVRGVLLIRSGQTTAPEARSDDERRY
jgi:uncharacterized membrane protein